jgi:hypothetical protein
MTKTQAKGWGFCHVDQSDENPLQIRRICIGSQDEVSEWAAKLAWQSPERTPSVVA